MASAEAVRKVLLVGSEQEVDGSFIRVQRFERQHGESFDEEEEEGKLNEEQDSLAGDPLGEVGWARQHTESTTASNSDSSFDQEQQ